MIIFRLFILILIIYSVNIMSGCSGKNKLTHEESCNQKFEKLHAKFEKKKYSILREPLSDLLVACPGSGFISQALFELAESHYHLKEWLEARAEYNNLLRDFPDSKFSETSFFKMAVCSHKQIASVDRDQAYTKDAIESYRLFLANYPESELADSAKSMIDELNAQLASKDMRIAQTYLKLNEPQAAAIYLKSVLKKYGDLVDLKQVHIDLTTCYIALNQFDTAEEHLKKLKEADSDKELAAKIQKLNQKLEKRKSAYHKKK